MHVLQVPYTFVPDPPGGTEVYVEALARGLIAQGCGVTVAAPARESASYVIDHLPVRRFCVAGDPLPLEQLYGQGDPKAEQSFREILNDVRPDIVHLHAFTPAISIWLARLLRQLAVPTVLTYHTPTLTCQRGTLMEYGERVCDGVVTTLRCSRCYLLHCGAGRASASALGTLPSAVGRALSHLNLAGGCWTALRMTELIRQRIRATQELFEMLDCIVAPSGWVRTLLIANGVNPGLIAVSPQGWAAPAQRGALPTPRSPDTDRTDLRIAYFGRLDPTKGIDVLVDALRLIPDARIRLDIYGVSQAGSAAYACRVKDSIRADARISLLPPVNPAEVVELLQRYEALAVPSVWLETGPLVVLEAFAAGIPVIGSRLGGIAERVSHDVDGLLLPPGDAEAWARALRELAESPTQIERLKKGVKPPRTMDQVVDEMLHLYEMLARRDIKNEDLYESPQPSVGQTTYRTPEQS